MKTRFYVKGLYPNLGWLLLFENYHNDMYSSKEEFEEDYKELIKLRKKIHEMFNKEGATIQFEDYEVMIKMNDLAALKIDLEIIDEQK